MSLFELKKNNERRKMKEKFVNIRKLFKKCNRNKYFN